MDKIANFVKNSYGVSLALTGVDSNALFESARSIPEMVEGFPPKTSDLLVIDSRGEDIGIDVVRTVESFLTYSPEVSSKKYVVLKDLDRLTQQAANAFLKTLEEPPEYAVILTTTTMWYYLLPTVRSRLVRFNLPPRSVNIGDPWLEACCELDSRVSEGEGDINSMKDALKFALLYEESPRLGCLAFKHLLEEIENMDFRGVVKLLGDISNAVSGKDSFDFLKRFARFSMIWLCEKGLYDVSTFRFLDNIARSKFSNFNTVLTLVNIILRVKEMVEGGAESNGLRGGIHTSW